LAGEEIGEPKSKIKENRNSALNGRERKTIDAWDQKKNVGGGYGGGGTRMCRARLIESG